MEITFTQPIDIVTIPESKEVFDKIKILQMIDYPSQKMVVAVIEKLGNKVLWQDAEYDSIGQWTDRDVEDRIREMYGDI